jgi:hypothetical protein
MWRHTCGVFARFAERAAPALAIVLAIVLSTASPAQCRRTWISSPNGVYGGISQTKVLAMTEWTPPGSQTPVLVVGGNFSGAGEIVANNIAYWDGSLWHTLGAGLNAPVYAVAVLDGVLYAGGAFTASGTEAVHYFVQWTGSAWVDTGFGTDGPVYALAADESQIFLGGAFTHVAGGLAAVRYFASYAQGSWNGYPPVAAIVLSIAILNGNPAIICEESGGSGFNAYVQSMYLWDGSEWQLLDRLRTYTGMGVSGGGLFYSQFLQHPISGCTQNEYGILRYDGVHPTQITSLYHRAPSFVQCDGLLYALGEEQHECPPVNAEYNGPWLGAWDGNQWTDLNESPGFSDGLLGSANGVLYVGGSFDHLSNDISQFQATNIAQLLNSQWQSLAVGLNGPVTCSANGSLYIGGNFTGEGSTSLPYAASWNGETWIAVAPFSAPVTGLFYYNSSTINPFTNSLVASGQFTAIGATPFNHIAIQDPMTFAWSAMGTGVDAPALGAMSVRDGFTHNDLIVGGHFITAGGLTANHVARWTGAAWETLGTGTNGDVHALANFGGQIVAAGSFDSAGGESCSNIAGWNGSSWSPLGAGFNATVRALAVYNDQLFAGGDFTMSGGAPAMHLAVWNGAAWSTFNGGTDGPVNAIVISGTDLIIGGSFGKVGLIPANNIADWDGRSWNGVGAPTVLGGEGVDGPVLTLSISGGTLLAGGSFTHADLQYSPNAAIALTPGAPSITQQPTDASICPGGSASFTFGIDPGGWSVSVGYNWYANGTLISDGQSLSGSIYSHSATATLTIDNASVGDTAGLKCVAVTACGQELDSATVQLTVGGPPCCGSADFNHDGNIGTDADIEAFFACIAGNCCPTCDSPDFNADGDYATDADIEAFFRVLAGGTC